jgi:hypothetical protein
MMNYKTFVLDLWKLCVVYGSSWGTVRMGYVYVRISYAECSVYNNTKENNLLLEGQKNWVAVVCNPNSKSVV